jgi:2-keto-4-pentenoate hydratase/2-oxohepta-3-ene-1,7-dioic acid hydratase in catechol pathway
MGYYYWPCHLSKGTGILPADSLASADTPHTAINAKAHAAVNHKGTPMRTSKWLYLLLIGIPAGAFWYTWTLSQPVFDTTLDEEQLLSSIRTAPIEEAITMAKLQSGNVILVLSADGDGIEGLDLASVTGSSFTDTLDAYNRLGADHLRVIASNQQNQRNEFTWESLGIPVNDQYPHIAAGTNYRAHADEVGHTGDPFVFPKLSHATAWNAAVDNGARLDYEVELCAVPLTTHTPQDPAKLGYLLCGDYTDRWTLIKEMDIGAPMGPTGFPSAKGGDTRFPVGALLVVPQARDFYKHIQIELYVNDQLRQQASAGQMIWSPERILNEALTNCKVPYFTADAQTVVTPSCDEVPAGTMLLTGTPGGVMFNVITLWNPRSYLRAGDVVISSGTYLGLMRNTVH